MRTALYTTVYPGVERFLPAWAESVDRQVDKDFDLVVGVDDGVDSSILAATLPTGMVSDRVMAEPGDTPAGLRQRAFDRIAFEYDAVICVDSDDILYPTRVQAAKAWISNRDAVACALDLIDESGKELGEKFTIEEGCCIPAMLPRYNVFGLSNTCWKTAELRKCLPIPEQCILVDWYLATAACIGGAKMGFDPDCHMAYRQHANNTARILPPFTASEVLKSAELVLGHYRLVFRHLLLGQTGSRSAFEKARSEVSTFYDAMSATPDLLETYVAALNALPSRHIWWSCVAEPRMEQLWKS